MTSGAVVSKRTCVSWLMIYEYGVHFCIAKLDTISLSLVLYLNIRPIAMGYVSKLLIMESLIEKQQVSLPFHEDNKWCLHTCGSTHLRGCHHQEGMASLRCNICFPGWRIQDLHKRCEYVAQRRCVEQKLTAIQALVQSSSLMYSKNSHSQRRL